MVSQVTLSLMLLAVAGLFLRTLRNLENQNFGFDRHNVLLVKFNSKFAGYKPEQLNALYERMVERFTALPGVKVGECFRAAGSDRRQLEFSHPRSRA